MFNRQVVSVFLALFLLITGFTFAIGQSVGEQSSMHLPLIANGSGIQLHGGWDGETVYSGYVMSFTLSSGEVATWTGTQPESGVQTGTVYTTRFRRINTEVITATLAGGDVLTKSVAVLATNDESKSLTTFVSCYTDCKLDDSIVNRVDKNGPWGGKNEQNRYLTWLTTATRPNVEYFNMHQPVFAFVLDEEVMLVETLGLSAEIAVNADPNNCNYTEYLNGYYCSNAYWHLVSVSDASSVASASFEALTDIQPWQRHVRPQFVK